MPALTLKQIGQPLLVLLLLVASIQTGCQSPRAGFPDAGGAVTAMRNNCYSLLHQLLNDEKDVGLLRFIKHEEDDVKKLVKKIAASSAAGAKLLEEFARKDPSIRLDADRLPSGELATREAIAATKQKELLGQTGDTFELSLLLTQAEALSYGWHLAQVASENEPDPERARALAGLGKDMENLYHEVFGLLLAKAK